MHRTYNAADFSDEKAKDSLLHDPGCHYDMRQKRAHSKRSEANGFRPEISW